MASDDRAKLDRIGVNAQRGVPGVRARAGS